MLPLLLLLAQAAVPAGQVIPEVRCTDDQTESYALYLPSNYSPERSWPIIFAFDPGARGRVPVERYQAAAEQYGYIVAGSNNSRNGPWEVSMKAARAMILDAGARLRIDEKRAYLAGMSGGSRVALGIALGSKNFAGVIASSAGFPDSKPRKTVPFPIFETAGSEDFNLREMRELDRTLTSPHRLAVFEGSHVWLPSEVAVEAVEWLEVQSAKAGLPVERQRIDAIFAKRVAAIERLTSEKDRYLALEALAIDFDGLRDVAETADHAKALGKDKRVREALKKEREEEAKEQRLTEEILVLERQLGNRDDRPAMLAGLRTAWKRLSEASKADADTPDRRTARRVLRGLSMGVSERASDPEYRKIVEEFRATTR